MLTPILLHAHVRSVVQVTVNFWILWSALCVGMGAGFTMLNNLAQIVEALGGDRQAQGVYVLLFTTVNTLGRMAGGYLPERLLHARGTPRYHNDELSMSTRMAQL